jgi:hypothetical protein
VPIKDNQFEGGEMAVKIGANSTSSAGVHSSGFKGETSDRMP